MLNKGATMEKRLFCKVCKYGGWSHACGDCYSDAGEFILDESKLNDMEEIVRYFLHKSMIDKINISAPINDYYYQGR